MNKYLIEILKNHSSLILPGIGALMVTNRKTGEIKFNPHLTFNDGALANFIASEEKIEKAEAQNKVAKFTSEIKSVIDKGDTYDIFQFGTIFKNKNGETAFEMAASNSDKAVKKAAPKVEPPKSKPAAGSKAVAGKGKDSVKKTTEAVKKPIDKTAKAGSKIVQGAASKAVSASKTLKDKGSATAKKTTDAAKKTTEKVVAKAENTVKKSTDAAVKAADKTANVVESTIKKTASTVKDGLTAGKEAAGKIADKTSETVSKVAEKAKEVKNTYVPPVDKEKLPDVPKIVTAAASTAGKTAENIAAKTKETVAATGEYIEKKKRRWWPIILLLLLVGIAAAAYFFRDKIKSYLGWDDTAKIENVNNYPDADGDGIPDFADVDLTGGNDEDGDGIDDLADLDYTHGTDEDGDGIDDAFAAASVLSEADSETDPLAMSDEDGDGIPDYADINMTEGEDTNDNGIDDRFDSAITNGTDVNKDCIDDSLANIALLNHLKGQMQDSNDDGIPDFADAALTGGVDINKNGIDDSFESVDMDRNGDGLNDSILMAMAVSGMTGSTDSSEAQIEDIDSEEEVTAESSVENQEYVDDTEIETETEETVVENTVPEKVVESKPPTTPAPVNPSKSDYSATGNYHAIGAAFAVKSNAEGYTSDMLSKGFDAKIIGRFDGLYLVSLKPYSSIADAKADLSNMRSTSGSAWIFKH